MSNSKKSNISIIQKALFVRDFSEYESEIERFFKHDVFIEILNEYYLCETKIEDCLRCQEMVQSYKQIQKELRIEIINFINQPHIKVSKNNDESKIQNISQ